MSIGVRLQKAFAGLLADVDGDAELEFALRAAAREAAERAKAGLDFDADRDRVAVLASGIARRSPQP